MRVRLVLQRRRACTETVFGFKRLLQLRGSGIPWPYPTVQKPIVLSYTLCVHATIIILLLHNIMLFCFSLSRVGPLFSHTVTLIHLAQYYLSPENIG